MRYILLLRHAKSSWEHFSLDDFDRPLSKRGLKDAPKMGKFLRNTGYIPEYVVSSPAKRAKQTTTLCLEGMQSDEDMVTWNRGLYFETVNKYMEAIQEAPSDYEKIMIVGHNPLIEATATILTGGKEKAAFRVPTAGLICLETHALEWSDINFGTCEVKWMMIPKILQ